MFRDWFKGPTNRKPETGPRNSSGRRGSGAAGRRLLLEPLEDRSLLSVSLGPLQTVSASMPLSVQASHAASSHAMTAVATQLVMHLTKNVPYGVPVTVRVAALNAQNHVVQSYAGSVTVTSSDANATLPTSVAFKHGYATFQVTFATTGSQTLTVTDSSNTSLTETATTTVADPVVATQLTLRVPKNVPNGVPVTARLAALDAQNHPVLNYSGSITLESSDPGAALPDSITFNRGLAVFQVTFTTAGQQTLTAADDADPTLTATATTTVADPIVATQFTLRVPKNVRNGVPVTVRLAALDAQNHVVQSYTGPVTLDSSDTGATLPDSITFNRGVATFQVTFTTAGQQTLTATDDADSTLTATATTTVADPIVATQFAVGLPKNVITGQPVTVRVAALDAQNRPVQSYAGPVTLSSSDTGATLPTSVTFDHGFATFQVTFSSAGQQTLTVTDGTNSLLTTTATTNVAAPAVATQFKLGLPKNVTSGVPVMVRVAALDAQNHPVQDYSGPVTLTSSDSGATLPTTLTFEHGYAMFQVTFATAGEQTLTVTDNGNATLTATAPTNVAAPAVATQFALGLPRNVTSGATVTVRLVALDAQNHPVQNYSGPVTLSSSDAGATLPTSVTFDHGFAAFQVTFATAGPQTLTATDTGNSALTTTVTTNVAAPAVATQFGLYMPKNVRKDLPVMVWLVALDAQNHPVQDYSGPVTLTSSDSGATLPTNIKFDHGYATFQVTFATAGQQTLTVTDNGNALLTSSVTTNVV